MSCQINLSMGWYGYPYIFYTTPNLRSTKKNQTYANIRFDWKMHTTKYNLPFHPPLITVFHSITHITTLIVNLYLNVMDLLENLQYYVKNSSNMQLSFCHVALSYSKLPPYILSRVNSSDTLNYQTMLCSYMRPNLILTTGLCFACSCYNNNIFPVPFYVRSAV